LQGISHDPNFSGMYYMEDENMDLFLIGDFMQTTESNEPNYEDEFYTVRLNLLLFTIRSKKKQSNLIGV
jgi:hypothetical protein